MTMQKAVSAVLETAKQIDINDSSKIIIMSDCHRGDGNWYDNFSANQNLYFYALAHYYKEGYIYIDLGDSEDLWENRNFSGIINMHLDIFLLLKQFYNESRLYLIYGNHDIAKRDDKWLQQNYYSYFDSNCRKMIPLFPDIKTYNGIVLNYMDTNNKILLLHGHQVDFLNSTLWRVARMIVRHLWRPLEMLGVHDPSRAGKNYKKMHIIEKKLMKWVKTEKHILVAGHTHRPVFPDEKKAPYFNAGCAVHPYSITGLEITNGEITLVKWALETKDDGTLFVCKNVLAGATKLSCYFEYFK